MTPPKTFPQPSVRLTRPPHEIRSLFFGLQTGTDVAELLEVPYMHLVHILYRRPDKYSYTKFQIAKRSGGVREISAPHNSLKILQSKFNETLQLVYVSKPSAHGFISGRSILSNALRHTGKRFVLNLDLEDFFPAIHFGRVRGVLMAPPYNIHPDAATVLAQLCSTDDGLPQGAPSSPMISNMVCARMDGQLQQLAKRQKCTYTRYADDITFSTTLPKFPHVLAVRKSDNWTPGDVQLGHALEDAISSNGFKVNESKTRLQFHDCHMEVTGLTVNRFPNVQRRTVRQVRAMLHAMRKHGLPAAQREFEMAYYKRNRNPALTTPSYPRVIRGKIDFIKMVKGKGNPTYRRLWNQLHLLAPDFAPYQLPEISEEPAAPGDATWAHWCSEYKNLVFQVVTRKNGDLTTSTAFLFSRALVATCAHGMDGEVEIAPPFPDGTYVSNVHLDGDGIDLAVIPFDTAPNSLHRLFQIRKEPLVLGEQVAALGFATIPDVQPTPVVREGIVEALNTDYGQKMDKITVSIPITGGMSGAPVIDRAGLLVGVVTQKSWEQTAEGVPAEPFRHVVPVKYLVALSRSWTDQSE